MRHDWLIYVSSVMVCVQIGSIKVADTAGRARINTQVPRGEDHAYWITYTATDAAGNEGTGLRQVIVSCPKGEMVCWENDDTRPSACSLNGACVDESLSGALGTADVDGTFPERVKPALLHRIPLNHLLDILHLFMELAATQQRMLIFMQV